MTIKEELIDYANRCLAGEEISGKKHKWACMRFLRDCKNEDTKNVQANAWLYHWDEEEASKIVEWFAMLRHSKGDLAGQPIRQHGRNLISASCTAGEKIRPVTRDLSSHLSRWGEKTQNPKWRPE